MKFAVGQQLELKPGISVFSGHPVRVGDPTGRGPDVQNATFDQSGFDRA